MAKHRFYDVLLETIKGYDSVALLLQTMGKGASHGDDFELSAEGVVALGEVADLARRETEERLQILGSFLENRLGTLSIETPTACLFPWLGGFGPNNEDAKRVILLAGGKPIDNEAPDTEPSTK